MGQQTRNFSFKFYADRFYFGSCQFYFILNVNYAERKTEMLGLLNENVRRMNVWMNVGATNDFLERFFIDALIVFT